jgi:hypothetical protein
MGERTAAEVPPFPVYGLVWDETKSKSHTVID